jgi:RNA recognition motif-containing protein
VKLYVGNLDREVTKENLQEAFQSYGDLGEVTVIRDRSNNVSKGFGFVEFMKKQDGEAAIAALHGKEFMGRTMDVNEARPKTENSSRGGFGGGRSGGGGGNRRY